MLYKIREIILTDIVLRIDFADKVGAKNNIYVLMNLKPASD